MNTREPQQTSAHSIDLTEAIPKDYFLPGFVFGFAVGAAIVSVLLLIYFFRG